MLNFSNIFLEFLKPGCSNECLTYIINNQRVVLVGGGGVEGLCDV